MIDWAKVTAAEVKEHGTRVGDTLGPLSREIYAGWLYQGYLVVVHETDGEIAAVFKRGPNGWRLIWLDSISRAGLAILTAAGVR